MIDDIEGGYQKKILITGSLGLTGSEAVKFFKEKGWEVVGIDSNMRSFFFNLPENYSKEEQELLQCFCGPESSVGCGCPPNVKDCPCCCDPIRNEKKRDYFKTRIDIRNEREVNNLFEENKFDAIIHTAAQPSHDYSKDHVLEDFDINARGTLILLEATRKYCPNAVFVHVSTDKVYGENMQIGSALIEKETRYICDKFHNYSDGYTENLGLDFAGSRSPFGCSKTSADIYAQEYAHYFGIKTGIFRLGCITGKNHKGAELHGFLAYLVKCIKEGKTYNIFGYKGKQVRDQIHAYDLVSAFYEFIQNPRAGEVYNIGGGQERSVSVLEAIDLIEKETGKKCVYNYVDNPRRGDRIWDIHDVSKFKSHYPNWKYKFSLQDIIKDLCES